MEGTEKVKTIIAEDVEVVGSIKCSSNIQIDGKLNGDLSSSGDAVIGATANVKGNLSVNSVTVLGQITGNTTAKDRIELKSTAHINGDIRAKRLTVEDGVTFVGKSEVNPSKIPAHTDSKLSAEETSALDTEENVDHELRGKVGGIFGRK